MLFSPVSRWTFPYQTKNIFCRKPTQVNREIFFSGIFRSVICFPSWRILQKLLISFFRSFRNQIWLLHKLFFVIDNCCWKFADSLITFQVNHAIMKSRVWKFESITKRRRRGKVLMMSGACESANENDWRLHECNPPPHTFFNCYCRLHSGNVMVSKSNGARQWIKINATSLRCPEGN